MESSKTSFQAETFSHTARLDLRVLPGSQGNVVAQGHCTSLLIRYMLLLAGAQEAGNRMCVPVKDRGRMRLRLTKDVNFIMGDFGRESCGEFVLLVITYVSACF